MSHKMMRDLHEENTPRADVMTRYYDSLSTAAQTRCKPVRYDAKTYGETFFPDAGKVTPLQRSYAEAWRQRPFTPTATCTTP